MSAPADLDVDIARRDARALRSVAVQFFVNGAMWASFVPRLPEIRTRIDVSVGTIGVLLAIGSITGLLGSITLATVIGRFGTRRVLIYGALALTVALAIVGLATHPAVLVVGLAGLSAFDVYVDSSMNMQASWLSGRRSVPVMNRLHGLWSLGTVLGGLVSLQLAAAEVPITTHLLVAALFFAVVVAYVGSGLLVDDEHDPQFEPDVGTDSVIDPDAEPSADPSAEVEARPRRPVVPSPLRRGLFVLGVLAACSIAMEMTTSDWAAFRLADDLDASPGVAVLGYVGFTVGMTVGRLGGDWAVTRFGSDLVLQGGTVIAAVGLATATLTPWVPTVVVGFLLAGLGVATQFPKLYDEAARHPGRAGAGLGALTGGSRIALLVVPLLVGTIADTSLGVGAAMAFVTLPAALVFVVLSMQVARRRAA
ncbi:MAG: MFS transporter [Actinomycetota bacterium]